jgi:predicted O-methyltransferase YrrM
MGASSKGWLRGLSSFIKSTPDNKSEDIRRDLIKARGAWFRALASHKDSFGRIPLPHPAPMLKQQHIEGCLLLASREAILKKMRTGGVAAEVGVQTGEFSRSILDICSPSKMHLIDIDLTTYAIRKGFSAEISSGIVQLHEGDSSSTLKQFPDSYFDFIYLDGDHSYRGVKRDIEVGKSKVKEEGFLIFNDYTYWSPVECIDYGVIRAVNELCIEEEWKMVYFALAHYMYCDVALKRPRPLLSVRGEPGAVMLRQARKRRANIPENEVANEGDKSQLLELEETDRSTDREVGISSSTSDQSNRLRLKIAELKAKLKVFELGWPPGHFYSPIPSLAEVRAREERIFRVPPQIPAVNLNEERQIRWIKEIEPFYMDQPFAATAGGRTRFHFENPNYSYGEALIYYAMLRRLRPKRVIEIGSGYSTLVLLDTVELFPGIESTCLCIDPYPELLQSLLRPGDETRITIQKSDLQEVDPGVFAGLLPGDILFVDSTHVSKVGSDINQIIFEILPSLPSGIYVHFHDIYYPFEYPKEWIYQGRAWNEAYVLRAFLQFNLTFRIQIFNSYLAQFHSGLLKAFMPLFMKAPGSSLWLKKV